MDADRNNPDDTFDARVHRTVGESFADASVSVDAGWRAVNRRMDEPSFVGVGLRLSRLTGVLTMLAAAAIVGIGFLLWRPANQPFRDIASAVGSRTTVTLRDGTRVILGPDSHVRIPRDFGVRGRTVNLDGEAYFAVVHDAKHPFTVLTHNLQIHDVGTEFDVRAYTGDASAQIGVTQGIVALSSSVGAAFTPRFSTLLRAGDLVTVDDRGTSLSHDTNSAVLNALTQGGLVFNETPLRDAVREISRTFGVTITVADSTLLTKRVTATFTGQTLDETLNEVTQIMGARYERAAHGIVIRGGLAASSDHPAPLTTARGLAK